MFHTSVCSLAHIAKLDAALLSISSHYELYFFSLGLPSFAYNLANYSTTTSLDITCQLKSKSLITHLLATNPEHRRGATITESSHQGASACPFLAGISGV